MVKNKISIDKKDYWIIDIQSTRWLRQKKWPNCWPILFLHQKYVYIGYSEPHYICVGVKNEKTLSTENLYLIEWSYKYSAFFKFKNEDIMCEFKVYKKMFIIKSVVCISFCR